MAYPTNYNFGRNWKKKIVPLLDDEKVKKALARGINMYLSDFPMCNRRYKKDTCPANYSSMDGYSIMMDRKREMLLEELREKGELPSAYLKLEKKAHKNEDLFTELMDYQDELLNPFFTWEAIKYDLESYCLFGSCHSYAGTFEITLARLVLPNEVWRVQSSDIHSTVINRDGTKVFDLLYWATTNNRLNHYVFGDPLKKQNKTYGGRKAFIDSE